MAAARGAAAFLVLVARIAAAGAAAAAVPAQAPVSTACPCSMSGDERQSWLPIAAGAAAAPIMQSASGLCLRVGLDDAAGGGAGLGGGTCQGACVTLATQCDTLWNVTLNEPDDGHVRVTVAAVGNAAAAELVGFEHVSMGGRAEVWPRDAACCGANRVVQEPDTGRLSFLVAPAACLVNASDCCPSATPGVECSGFGTCDVRTAQCACAACKSGGAADCSADSPAECEANGGACFAVDGRCLCSDGCRTGPTCALPKTCSGGGYCSTGGACACSDPCSAPTPAGDGCMPKSCGPSSVCAKGTCECTDAACSVLDEDTQTCVPIVDCGPFGTCSGGTCTCSSACWTGPFCNVSACVNNAICTDNAGVAACDCRSDCFTADAGGQCTVAKDCGAFGACPSSGVLVGYDDSGQDLADQPRVLSLAGSYADCWGLCNDTAGCVSWSYMVVAPPSCGGSGPLCWLKRVEPAFSQQQCRVAGEPGPRGGPGGQCECKDACGVMDGTGKCSSQKTCGAFGFCDPIDGCRCLPCYTKDANGLCSVPQDCGPGGFCEMGSCICESSCFVPDDDGRCMPRDCAHGTCQDADGSCACDACWQAKSGGACQIPTDCGLHGACSNASAPPGQCACEPCWLLDAQDQCTVQQSCSGAGTCDAGTGVCACSDLCRSGPTCSAVQACSNAGTCSGGRCVCDSLCRSGQTCEQRETCSAHGSCIEATGACACAPGYNSFAKCAFCDGCHSGTGCNVIDACNGNGVCQLDAQGFKSACSCAPGFSGDNCENAPGAAAAAGAGASAGAVAAGVTVPLLMAAAAVAYFLRRHAASARGGALLPSPKAGVAAGAAPGAAVLAAAASRAASLAGAAPVGAPAAAAAERASLLNNARGKAGAAPVLKYGI